MIKILIPAILITIASIFISWKRSKDLKKTSIAIASFIAIISLGVMGNITRSVMPIYIAHIILLVLAWGSIIWYLVKDRYYWWLIGSPVLTIILFIVMETLTGSGHENAIIQ